MENVDGFCFELMSLFLSYLTNMNVCIYILKLNSFQDAELTSE